MALSVKKLSILFIVTSIASVAVMAYSWNRIQEIKAFNQAVNTGKTPQTDRQSVEAKYATAYWLAKNERFKEATLLFSQLTNKGTPVQRASVYHNLGNMFFLKSLQVGGSNQANVRDEQEYLLSQAFSAYKSGVKTENSNWGTRRNLDRVILLMPEKPTPGVGDSENPGLIMGNIPNGLP
jgi:mxaK protein